MNLHVHAVFGIAKFSLNHYVMNMNMYPTKSLLLLLLLFLLSCSKDDASDIIGDWELAEFRVNCTTSSDENITVSGSEGCVTLFDETMCLTFRFFEDGTGTATQFFDGDTDTQLFVYTLDESNNRLSVCDSEGDDCLTGVLSDGELQLIETEDDCQLTQVMRRS